MKGREKLGDRSAEKHSQGTAQGISRNHLPGRQSGRSHSRTRSIVLCGLSIALLAVGAAIQLPLGPVPFTLQTMMLVIVVLILTPSEAVIAVGGYLVLGAIGLPVFSGLRGGFGVLLGPTGGFLTGFFVAALVVGLLRTLFERRMPTLYASVAFDVLLIVVMNLIYYVAGTWWFVFSTGATVYAALAACVLPFLATGVLKSIAAFVCVQPIRVALGRATWSYRSKAGDTYFHSSR